LDNFSILTYNIFLIQASVTGERRRLSGPKVLVAVLQNPAAPDDCVNNVCGNVTFARSKTGYEMINYTITGLPEGKHGLHVHMNPITTDCLSAGGHWNPTGEDHGTNLFKQRHVGDLGNILADATGLAEGTLYADTPLEGDSGILGRSVVVHAGEDDLGLGGNPTSRTVGNAGARPACGTIVKLN
jgi:Cu-Zn family superoxide dismutase